MIDGLVPGMVAVVTSASTPAPRLGATLAAEGVGELRKINGVWVASWGLPQDRPKAHAPLLLTTTVRDDGGRVEPAMIADWLAAGELDRLSRMHPPFAALGETPAGLRLATDLMGFRPLYRCEHDDWKAVSTSARLLWLMRGGGLDRRGVLLQSQLGWQVGSVTPFEGVRALDRGESIELSAGGLRSDFAPVPAPRPGAMRLQDGIDRAASVLREVLDRYLEDTPAPVLQLTGGQDSRIVLSAIPPARRRGITVMTLSVPGAEDVRIAGLIAGRYGMPHLVRGLSDIALLSSEEWFRRVLAAAVWHDCMADPLARAITGWAEESFPQGERLSGLGGEIARGFYYTGWVRPTPISREKSEALAKWRMLANDAVDSDALAVGHREDAQRIAIDQIHAALVDAGPEWFSATDDLYLHRMHRWAGLSESAVTFSRTLVNPMLDHRFIEVARNLSPAVKHRAYFLGRLQMALDEDLAGLPLDGRPPPRVFASPGPIGLARIGALRLRKLARKTRQRLTGSHRPPPGTTILAAKLTEHFRANPGVLEPARETGFLDESWMDGIVGGRVEPSPASLALLMNLLAAGDRPGVRR